MKSFKFKIVTIAAAFSLMLGACKKYLDITPDNVATVESSFSNANETLAYLYGCYSSLQSLADVSRNAGFTSSAETVIPLDIPSLSPEGYNLMRGLQNSANPLFNYWDGYNMGLNLWQPIRMCNTLIQNVNLPLDATPYQRTRWVAEAKFLKAYYHYWLLRMYGPIPLSDEALPVNASSDLARPKQQTLDSCFNYIVRLLDEAIKDLPPAIQSPVSEAGRITSTIAKAVKAEVLVTRASPLFNGNPDYASAKGIDGELLFPSSVDNTKWNRAAEACLEAINAAVTNGAALYQFVPVGNVVHLSDETKQLLTLQGPVVESWNTEQIWTLNPRFGLQYQAIPRVSPEAGASPWAVYSSLAVPLAQSELFYTKNGVPINEDKEWDYAGRYSLKLADNSTRYYIKNSYTTAKGNFDREPRYYSSVSFDGAVWFGCGKLDDNDPYYVNAINGWAAYQPGRYNVTGYWPKKLVHYLSAVNNQQQGVWNTYSWPFMRLTGLWLLYAECLNETGAPAQDVCVWVDQVRARAGLPGVIASWTNHSKNPSKPNTKEGMRQIIHQERRIELAFEGQAGWDLRRWKELQQVLSVPIQGWNTTNDRRTTAAFYQIVNVYQPIFNVRDYLFPIQNYDLLINPNLVQTPYW